MKRCLIGETLKHSFSPQIHKKLGDYTYDLCEISIDELENFVKAKEYDGYNVTIPYKEKIIPLLDNVSNDALAIGAVNTVVVKGDKTYGYNTDVLGMEYMLKSAGITLKDKTVMILGTGGTGKTATALAKKLGAKKIVTVSRSGDVNYDNCYDIKDVQVIINTTPVGMYPNCYSSPIDIKKLGKLEGVADVVYNPLTTKLVYDAMQLGIPAVNGLVMLVAQAKYASDLFTGKISSDDKILPIYNILRKQMQNVVLVGMPSSGKSSLGKALAKSLNKEFVDTDEEIVKKINCTIPDFFAKYGEQAFRKVESEVLKEVMLKRGAVIATGGGIVTVEENIFPLKSNSKVVYIKRSTDKLSRAGRPLSANADLDKMYRTRAPLYEGVADITAKNDGDFNQTVKEIIDKCEF